MQRISRLFALLALSFAGSTALGAEVTVASGGAILITSIQFVAIAGFATRQHPAVPLIFRRQPQFEAYRIWVILGCPSIRH